MSLGQVLFVSYIVQIALALYAYTRMPTRTLFDQKLKRYVYTLSLIHI